MKKIIIVGAGIAGLTLGVELQKYNFNFTIFEKNSVPGGLCGSWQDIDGYWHDYGPHVFHDGKYTDWFKQYVPEYQLLPRIDKIMLASEKMVDYPIQTSCKDDIRPNPNIDIDNYGSYCRHHYGDKLSFEFFFPYNTKFYGTHITNISELVAGRTPSIGQPKGQYLYPASGRFAELPEAIATKINNIQYSSSIDGIDLKHQLVLVNGKIYQYDILIWCADLCNLMYLSNYSSNDLQMLGLYLTTVKTDDKQDILALYSATKDIYHRMSYESTLKGDDSNFIQYESNRRELSDDNIISSFLIPNAYAVPTITWMLKQSKVMDYFSQHNIILHGRAATGIHKNIYTIIDESMELSKDIIGGQNDYTCIYSNME